MRRKADTATDPARPPTAGMTRRPASAPSWQSADDLIRAGADPAELRCHYHVDRLWDGTTPYAVPVCAECRDIADQTVRVWTDLIRADMDAAARTEDTP